MLMLVRPISAHCYNQYANYQDSKTPLFTSHTSILSIHTFLYSVIYLCNTCLLSTYYHTIWYMMGIQQEIHLFFIWKVTLFEVWKLSWKNVSQEDQVSVIVLKNFWLYHIRIKFLTLYTPNLFVYDLQIWDTVLIYCAHHNTYTKIKIIKDAIKLKKQYFSVMLYLQ